LPRGRRAGGPRSGGVKKRAPLAKKEQTKGAPPAFWNGRRMALAQYGNSLRHG